MKKDIHLAALRAASRVALSATVIAGCNAADDPPETAPQESNLTNGEQKFTCEDIMEAAFPTESFYRWEAETRSKATVACCDAELAKAGANTKHRWDCCVASESADAGPGSMLADKYPMACTPWGPPVPPAMRRALEVA